MTQKSRGRPPGGIREAAREAGIPEATYRRHVKRAAIDTTNPAGRTVTCSPAVLRISRHASDDAKRLAAAEAEIERLRADNDGLRQRVAELEAEIERIRPRRHATPSQAVKKWAKKRAPDRLARALYLRQA